MCGPTIDAYAQPASDATRVAIPPNRITWPMSAPTSATAASGPGVGGTIACVSCIAPTRPVAITLILSPLLIAVEWTSGLRMT